MIVKYLRVSTTKQDIGRQNIQELNFDTDSSTYKLLLDVFGGAAEMERETIQERVIQGVDKCKATGQPKTGRWFGREENQVEDLPKDFKKYYIKMINKEITKVEMVLV